MLASITLLLLLLLLLLLFGGGRGRIGEKKREIRKKKRDYNDIIIKIFN